MVSERLRNVIIAVVTTVWAANFLAGLFVQDYKPSESINAIFMAIVGTLFALGQRYPQEPPAVPKPPAQQSNGGASQ